MTNDSPMLIHLPLSGLGVARIIHVSKHVYNSNTYGFLLLSVDKWNDDIQTENGKIRFKAVWCCMFVQLIYHDISMDRNPNTFMYQTKIDINTSSSPSYCPCPAGQGQRGSCGTEAIC